MPLYEYQCQTCGDRFEELQRFNDPHLTVCRTCGGPLKRLISAPAVQFKGDGWYVTDYAKKGKDKGKGGGSEKAPASEASKGDGNAKASGSEKSGSKKGGESAA
ncbi:MAG: FmdB family zinc ribbon protein [Acidobacteriota bacterium]